MSLFRAPFFARGRCLLVVPWGTPNSQIFLHDRKRNAAVEMEKAEAKAERMGKNRFGVLQAQQSLTEACKA